MSIVQAVASAPVSRPERASPRTWWNRLKSASRQHFINRLPRSDTLLLTQRNVGILPTRAGLMMGLTLVVLLLASINYQLNLGYLLTFMLAGSALVGMHVGHATLRGLNLHVTPPAPQHANTTALFEVRLTNARRTTRHGIGLCVVDDSVAGPNANWSWTDVPALDSSVVRLAFAPASRGLHPLPPLSAETRFPLGTFRVWTFWRPAAQLLVYPEVEKQAPPLPWGESAEGQAGASPQHQEQPEFDGLRAWRRGDRMRQVVWKKAAKGHSSGGELVVRDSEQSARSTLWLDSRRAGLADAVGHAGVELALSRLCAWVVEAERRGLLYGLRLPGVTLPPGQGTVHQRNCLEALALW
ncbi:MAG: DUF58 domain-containing protein [Pseudomonadota bacterium]